MTSPASERPPLFITMHDRDNVAIVANDGGLPGGTVFPWYSRWYNIILLFSAAIFPLAMLARGFAF